MYYLENNLQCAVKLSLISNEDIWIRKGGFICITILIQVQYSLNNSISSPEKKVTRQIGASKNCRQREWVTTPQSERAYFAMVSRCTAKKKKKKTAAGGVCTFHIMNISCYFMGRLINDSILTSQIQANHNNYPLQ